MRNKEKNQEEKKKKVGGGKTRRRARTGRRKAMRMREGMVEKGRKEGKGRDCEEAREQKMRRTEDSLTVAQMHTCISKANTCQSRSQQHLALRLHIIRVPNRARQVLDAVI